MNVSVRLFSKHGGARARRMGKARILVVEDESLLAEDIQERLVILTALRDDQGRLLGFAQVTRDITGLKQAEKELTDSREQLRALAAYLQSVREEERTRIAREVHDELGQALTGLKMDLAWLEKQLAEAGRLPSLRAGRP